jgi:hypothetical protein
MGRREHLFVRDLTLPPCSVISFAHRRTCEVCGTTSGVTYTDGPRTYYTVMCALSGDEAAASNRLSCKPELHVFDGYGGTTS